MFPIIFFGSLICFLPTILYISNMSLTKVSIALDKCEKRYGGKYSLELKGESIDSNAMVLCRCNEHNTNKYVNLRHFLGGDSCGCSVCLKEKYYAKEKKKYIDKFTEKWGNGYTFDKLNYISLKDPGIITCKKHGDFTLSEIRYGLDKISCPVCYEQNKRNIRNSEYLLRLKEKYADTYTWLTTDFGDYYTDYVEFICPKHGVMKQTLCILLNTEDEDGYACPKCKKERSNEKQSYTLDEAISHAKSLESCKYYDFSIIKEWKGVKAKHTLKCKRHGDVFEQTFDSMFQGHNGCPSCKSEYIHDRDALTTEEFIEKARKIHGNKYDYSKVEYYNNTTKVCIICPKHGEFWQTPYNHLMSRGCPKCHESTLETKIRVFLDNNDIEYIQEKSLRDLTGKILEGSGQPQRIDFFLPKYNVCIECQGIQHFSPIKFGRKMIAEAAEENYRKCVIRDKFKYESLVDGNYDIIYFTKKSIASQDISGWYSDKKCFYNTDSVLDYLNAKK